MLPQTNPDSPLTGDTFEITRYFTASPDLVFDAWIGDEWTHWLPYPHAAILFSEIDTRPGGRYQITLGLPDEQTLTVSGTYQEVIRPKKLVFTWLSSLSEHDSLVSVILQPSGDGTLMTLRHEGLPNPTLLTSHRNGWLGAFDRLQSRVLDPHLIGDYRPS